MKKLNEFINEISHSMTGFRKFVRLFLVIKLILLILVIFGCSEPEYIDSEIETREITKT